MWIRPLMSASKGAYEAAMDQGLWQGTYASSDRREYWAESTHAWFYPDHSYSFNQFGNTRQDLKKYDPGVANLLTEIYGDHPWQYTLTTTRTHLPHLQGFNPQDSPTFVGFPELEAIFQQLRIPHSDGNGAWVNLPLHDPTHLPNLIKSNVLDAAAVTAIAFVNLSGMIFYCTDLTMMHRRILDKSSLNQSNTQQR